ncbi:unnamed protein product [Scytosiphon promiscuus]
MDMMSSFGLYSNDVSTGMYSDAALASLPRTIAMMNGQFLGMPTTWDSMAHANKRSRTDTTSSSSCSSYSASHSESEVCLSREVVDEKKMLDRERNRKQARKSRELKKQCVDKMQQELKELEKESAEAAARDKEAAKKLQDSRTSRCQTLRKASPAQVFNLRADGCTDEASWLEVLSPELHMTMPITPYRSFNPADVVNNRRVLLGVDGMISDTQSLAVLLDNIGVKTRHNESSVSIKFTLGSDSSEEGRGAGGAFFSRDGVMSTFNMRTLDAVKHGAKREWEVNGMVRARFNSDSNKIEELDMTFDAVACYQQLMLAAGKTDFPPVPNTLENALKDEKTRIVVTTAKRPFRITHVNKAWTELCGFELEECAGKSLNILQARPRHTGPETDMMKVDKLCKLSQKGYASSMVVTNKNKKGELFRNHLRCYPVSSDEPGQISHIVGMLTAIPPSSDEHSGAGGGNSSRSVARSSPAVQAF